MADYLGLLRELGELDPPVYVFGSVAESVLLDGALSPSHGDVDLLIPRGEFELRLGQLGQLGFASFAVYYEPRRGLPLVCGSFRGELALELSLLDSSSDGDPYFAVRNSEGVLAVSMPRDLFEWPPTTIDGVAIRTLSPLALVQIRAGLLSTRALGPARAGKDLSRQSRLLEAFFPGSAPSALEPRIRMLAADEP